MTCNNDPDLLAKAGDAATATGLAVAVGGFYSPVTGHGYIPNSSFVSRWGRLAGRFGAGLDAYDAYDRYQNGDTQGALISVAKTALGIAGVAASITPLGAVLIGVGYTALSIWQQYNDHKVCYPPEYPTYGGAPYVKSPLAIDLDGDGIATYAIHNRGVYFDIDADGFAETTGWLNNKDAFLILDRNKNGKIDDASELFGDSNKAINGFEIKVIIDNRFNQKLIINDDLFVQSA